ncbi:hypothetical protein ACA910_005221 [Epithemia clementina (nom. ined.)]
MIALLSLFAAGENMNEGPYRIANSDTFDSNYDDSREFFDVYSKTIRTLYSQVHWTCHGDLPLPREIVERFRNNGKVMAVTGYEVDQFMLNEAGEEVSVPITWAYNHHYGFFIRNSKLSNFLKVPTVDVPKPLQRIMSHGSDHVYTTQSTDIVEKDDPIPKSQFFSEGNGGEMRKSYHGYPKNYDQLIESPDTYVIFPMQIDTWNREHMTNSTFVRGPLPNSASVPKTVPESEPYSPLLECPCTDRLEKKWGMTYTLSPESRTGDIDTAPECFLAATQVVPSNDVRSQTVHDFAFPSGCSIRLEPDGTLNSIWNSADASSDVDVQSSSLASPTHDDDAVAVVGVTKGSLVNLTISIDPKADLVYMTLTGPADKWFGVGFGATSMCTHPQSDTCPTGGPYTIVVEGSKVVERKLDFHGPGFVLEPSIQVVSNAISTKGIRTVHISRSLSGKSELYFTFNATLITVPLILATGCGLEFAQHCGHGPSQIDFLPVDTTQQVWQAGISGTIGGGKFSNNDRCLPFPKSDLIDQKNPTCSIERYQGGLSCCVHENYLLDKDQEIPWSDQPLEYRLRFRVYFEEHYPATLPQNLIRLYWMTEAWAGEYDVPQCETSSSNNEQHECVHMITSRWKVVDMIHDCSVQDATWCTGTGSSDPNKTEGVKLIYAGPHCHAPTCLSMELWNADTGELLCRTEPEHGKGSGSKFDEQNFLSIPPCLWGDPNEGLVTPSLLSLNTTLLSIKRANSTYAHTGDMASWQMRGILVRREQQKDDSATTTVARTSLRSSDPRGS